MERIEIKQIVFDMDGVILDTERAVIKAWKKMGPSYGITDLDYLEKVCVSCIGSNAVRTKAIMEEAFRDIVPGFDYTEYRRKTDEYLKEVLLKEMPLKSGIRELLETLKSQNAKIALASSTRIETVKRELSAAGLLDFFDVIVGGDMVRRSKPEPDIYLYACELLGVDPTQTYAIEDSANGIRSAAAAGMKVIMVPDLIPPTKEITDLCIGVFESLDEVLAHVLSPELVMLGTGHAMALKCYNTCFVIKEGIHGMLVDAGGGNQILRNLELARIPLTMIHDIFITHNHSDHIAGVIWMVRGIATAMRNGRYHGECRIYAHEELREDIYGICRIALTDRFMNYCIYEEDLKTRIEAGTMEENRIVLVQLHNEETRRVMYSDIKFVDLESDKTKQYGFSMVLPNGKSLVCAGDEPLHRPMLQEAVGCDYLLCESYCMYQDRDIFEPYEKFHSTVKDASLIAQDLGVKNLVLYHTEDEKLPTRKREYTAESKLYYKGNVFVPDDLETIVLG